MNPAEVGNKKTFNAQYSDELFDEHDVGQDRKFAEAQSNQASANNGTDGASKRKIVIVLFRNDLRCVGAQPSSKEAELLLPAKRG